MANRLAGKYAEVTGAASGLGKAVALAYLKKGAKVLRADINAERLKEAEAEFAALGYFLEHDVKGTFVLANAGISLG